MANNTALIGDAETLLQILNNDFSETEGRFEDNNITTIRAYAFYNKDSLKHISTPNVISVGQKAFSNCSAIESIYMPNVVTIDSNAFAWTGSASTPLTAVFPKVSGILKGTFNRAHVQVCDLGPGVTQLASDAFYTNGNSVICQTLILRKEDGIVTAGSADSINGLRDVYVPSALISTYQSATYWSTNSNITFHAIEGSEYEHYYADGTPVE